MFLYTTHKTIFRRIYQIFACENTEPWHKEEGWYIWLFWFLVNLASLCPRIAALARRLSPWVCFPSVTLPCVSVTVLQCYSVTVCFLCVSVTLPCVSQCLWTNLEQESPEETASNKKTLFCLISMFLRCFQCHREENTLGSKYASHMRCRSGRQQQQL